MASSLKSIEFWYEFASPYSYLAAMRVEEVAIAHEVLVEWKPFLLGPIFKQQGLDDTPFNIFKAKGAYMWRDMERACFELNLDFQKPSIFPQNGLFAARLAMCEEVKMRCPEFTQAVFSLQFDFDGCDDIGNFARIHSILEDMGLDSEKAFEQSESKQVKLALREQTEQAAQKGIFGAPTFITSDGELFWGNDRLEQAVAWAASSGHKS